MHAFPRHGKPERTGLAIMWMPVVVAIHPLRGQGAENMPALIADAGATGGGLGAQVLSGANQPVT